MQKWCVVLLALAAILAGCDKRDAEKPDMTFTASRDTLTNTVPTQNYCTLTVRLEGTEGSTLYERINFTYETTLGTIVGDSSSTSAYTDSLGFATVEFVADADAVGPVYLTASMEKYPLREQDARATVLDCRSLRPPRARLCSRGRPDPGGHQRTSSPAAPINIAVGGEPSLRPFALPICAMVTDGQRPLRKLMSRLPPRQGAYETEVSLEDFPRSVTNTHRSRSRRP
jgi:hypothetical protein